MGEIDRRSMSINDDDPDETIDIWVEADVWENARPAVWLRVRDFSIDMDSGRDYALAMLTTEQAATLRDLLDIAINVARRVQDTTP